MIRVLSILAVTIQLLAACAPTGPVRDIQPGQRPAIESDEAGFWMVMDRVEKQLRTSGRIVRDRDLNAYVQDVVCRITPDYCADIRVYVIRQAGFNASMAPNGSMRVWTGLLLRSENEAQLAFVLGHEMGHYLKRHTLQRWRDARAKSDAGVFFSVAGALAGIPFAGDLAQLALIGSIYAFSRDQEREADRIGFELVAAAGYDPAEAAAVWHDLNEEKEAGDWDSPPIFFASHPPSAEREATLEGMAQQVRADGGYDNRDSQFHQMTLPLRADWLRDELRQRNFGSMEYLLDRLTARGYQLGEVSYFRGEMYRLRDQEDDLNHAVDAYRESIATHEAPAETYRSLGLVYWSKGESAAARQAFEEYLRLSPEADDRLMILAHIEELS